jgi:hypothetical protein
VLRELNRHNPSSGEFQAADGTPVEDMLPMEAQELAAVGNGCAVAS